MRVECLSLADAAPVGARPRQRQSPAQYLAVRFEPRVHTGRQISSSSSKAGDIVKAHLENALVVDGVTIAPPGQPIEIKIADASPASNPDIYGFVDIYFRPLTSSTDGRTIPLRAPASRTST